MNKQYYIYLTTNLINNKQYIGQHYGYINDSYLGSGRLLIEDIKEYGKENFKKEIIEFCSNREEADKKEQYWISFYNAVKDEKYYNIAKGGHNNVENLIKWREEHPEEAKKIVEKMMKKGVQWAKEHPKEHQKNLKNLIKWKEEHPEEFKTNSQKNIKKALEWHNQHPKVRKTNGLKTINQLQEWRKENYEEWLLKNNVHTCKKVRCIETGETFDSIKEAAASINRCQQALSKHLNGHTKFCGKTEGGIKLHWEFISYFTANEID